MIEIRDLTKTFQTPDSRVEALRNISLTIRDKDIYGVIGMSGAGKSTLVRCINMLERPTSGTVVIDGRDMGSLGPAELREARRGITMIFQGFNLLMQRNCLANICFPLKMAGVKRDEAERRAMELLELVGLPDKAKAYPAQLSGGQQQRIAIARALATSPKILLCDEATSALDPKTTHAILELIRDINRRLGITVIVITHQMSVVEEICNRVAILDGGEVVEEGEVTSIFAHPKSAAARRMVFPELEGDAIPRGKGVRTVQIVYRGAAAAMEPTITQMAIDERITANIAYASTRAIGERAYGTMLLTFPDDDETVRRAMAYLRRKEDVTVEEVSHA